MSEVGRDGYVRLRAYLRHADSQYLSACCAGRQGCGRVVDLSIARAIEVMGGDGSRTVRELGQRLRCSRCGGRDIRVSLGVDTRPEPLRQAEGSLRVFRDGMAVKEDQHGGRGGQSVPHDTGT